MAARPPSEPLWESLRRSFDPLELTSLADVNRGLRTMRVMMSTPALRERNLERHIAWANMLEPVVIERLDGPAETRHFRAQTLIHSALSCLDVALAGVDLPQREDTIPFAARPGIQYPEPLTTARPIPSSSTEIGATTSYRNDELRGDPAVGVRACPDIGSRAADARQARQVRAV